MLCGGGVGDWGAAPGLLRAVGVQVLLLPGGGVGLRPGPAGAQVLLEVGQWVPNEGVAKNG